MQPYTTKWPTINRYFFNQAQTDTTGQFSTILSICSNALTEIEKQVELPKPKKIIYLTDVSPMLSITWQVDQIFVQVYFSQHVFVAYTRRTEGLYRPLVNIESSNGGYAKLAVAIKQALMGDL